MAQVVTIRRRSLMETLFLRSCVPETISALVELKKSTCSGCQNGYENRPYHDCDDNEETAPFGYWTSYAGQRILLAKAMPFLAGRSHSVFRQMRVTLEKEVARNTVFIQISLSDFLNFISDAASAGPFGRLNWDSLWQQRLLRMILGGGGDEQLNNI